MRAVCQPGSTTELIFVNKDIGKLRREKKVVMRRLQVVPEFMVSAPHLPPDTPSAVPSPPYPLVPNMLSSPPPRLCSAVSIPWPCALPPPRPTF